MIGTGQEQGDDLLTAPGLAAAVWIVDYGAGRLNGGHQEDYLAALEKALAGCRTRVAAPFRAGATAGGRAAAYLSELRLFWRLLHDGPRFFVCHTPEFRDFLMLALAALATRRPRATGLFVLRRDGPGIVGRPGAKARLLERLIPALIRRRYLYPVSDSRPVLEYWLARAGAVSGSLVSIPIPAARRIISKSAWPVVGLVGRFRIEKGARHYDAIIRLSLDLFPNGRVSVQLTPGLAGEEGELIARLLSSWSGHPRVELSLGHLPADQYADAVAATDIVVAPYEVSSYGDGTSGVLHDALSLGATVLATSIPWARDAFPNDPRIVWLRGTEPADLREGLLAAGERSKANRDQAREADSFAADWQAALSAAYESLAGRRKG